MNNFLAGKDLAPAEKEKMSGKEITWITQVDLDALLARTTVTNAKWAISFIGNIESTWEIKITRTSEDSTNQSESIFPQKDGTFIIGNVLFPNITDAIKAANIRNWVSWHANNGHDIYNDGDDIEVLDWGVFRWWQTDLIDWDSLPEFITHGKNAAGESLDTLPKIFDFLQGATKAW
jgi:hypothetical protein